MMSAVLAKGVLIQVVIVAIPYVTTSKCENAHFCSGVFHLFDRGRNGTKIAEFADSCAALRRSGCLTAARRKSAAFAT